MILLTRKLKHINTMATSTVENIISFIYSTNKKDGLYAVADAIAGANKFSNSFYNNAIYVTYLTICKFEELYKQHHDFNRAIGAILGNNTQAVKVAEELCKQHHDFNHAIGIGLLPRTLKIAEEQTTASPTNDDKLLISQKKFVYLMHSTFWQHQRDCDKLCDITTLKLNAVICYLLYELFNAAYQNDIVNNTKHDKDGNILYKDKVNSFTFKHDVEIKNWLTNINFTPLKTLKSLQPALTALM